MAGIDRLTGKMIEAWPHTVMCIVTIFTTRFGSRERRRNLGSRVPNLFGENLDEPTLFRYMLAIMVAIRLQEPRFYITKIDVIAADNTPEQLRGGRFSFAMRGQFRPRALLGDLTPAPGLRTLYVGQGATDGVLVL